MRKYGLASTVQRGARRGREESPRPRCFQAGGIVALRPRVGLVRSHKRALAVIGSHRSGRTRLVTRAVEAVLSAVCRRAPMLPRPARDRVMRERRSAKVARNHRYAARLKSVHNTSIDAVDGA